MISRPHTIRIRISHIADPTRRFDDLYLYYDQDSESYDTPAGICLNSFSISCRNLDSKLGVPNDKSFIYGGQPDDTG